MSAEPESETVTVSESNCNVVDVITLPAYRLSVMHLSTRFGAQLPFSSYLTLNNIVTLKLGLEVTQGH